MSGMIIKPTLFSFYIFPPGLRHLPLTTVKLMEAAIPRTLFVGGYCEGELKTVYLSPLFFPEIDSTSSKKRGR